MKSKNIQVIWKCVLAAVVAALMLVGSAQAADKYEVLHYFEDAANPYAGLVADLAGNLYGTTSISDHGDGGGTVFKLTRESAGKWSFSIIHEFKGPDGAVPLSSLIFDSSSNLYGTTNQGGAHNLGTVFELSPSGSNWKEKLLYSFGRSPDDLIFPSTALTWDTSGNLYGTSPQTAGGSGYGGVFELKRSGSRWKEKVIYLFTGGSDGGNPSGSLVADSAGNLYGASDSGGLYNQGVVYELTPSSDGRWREAVLYNFTGGVLGGQPAGGLIFDAAGNLYGMTYSGGFYTCGNIGCGTVFSLRRSTGHWNLRVLHSFDGSDGDGPDTDLIFDSTGSLYGTTSAGGQNGYGVVFKLLQSGSRWTETQLHSFDGKDGANPYGGLILDQQGDLYGTTIGGIQNFGVVFRMTP